MGRVLSSKHLILAILVGVLLGILGTVLLGRAGGDADEIPAFRIEVALPSVPSVHGAFQAEIPVSLQGHVIGSVSGTYIEDIEEEPRAIAVLSIRQDERHLRWLRTDSTFRAATSSLFGDQRIEITAGRSGERLQNGARVTGETGATLQDALDEIRGMSARLEPALTSLSGALGSIGGLVNQPAILMQFGVLLQNLAWITGQMKEAMRRQEFGRTWSDLSQTAANLNQLTTRLIQVSDRLEQLLPPPRPPEDR